MVAFAGREPAAGRMNEGPESEKGIVETIPEQDFLMGLRKKMLRELHRNDLQETECRQGGER